MVGVGVYIPDLAWLDEAGWGWGGRDPDDWLEVG